MPRRTALVLAIGLATGLADGPCAQAAGVGELFREQSGARMDTAGSRAEGLAAYRGGKFATAVRLLTPFAQAGDAEAATALAIILRGFGELGVSREAVVQNLPGAAGWFKRAAQAGEPRAMVELAQMIEHGEGLPPDPVAAYQYYGAAAWAYSPGTEQTRAVADALRLKARIEIAIARGDEQDPKIQKLAAAWQRSRLAQLPLVPAGIAAARKP
jgi:hypothetical protein